MSGKIRVVTDSTASIPQSLLETWGIEVVPLVLHVEEQEFHENTDFGPEALISHLEAKQRILTSQPTPKDFLQVYQRLTAQGVSQIISIHLSGQLSGTIHAAAIAARECHIPVEVVDSRTVAMGLGFSVIKAATLSAQGAAFEEVLSASLQTASKSRVIFALDTLEFLRRGGRISPAAATLGTMLGLRPILEVLDGKIEVSHRVRGENGAITKLISLAQEQLQIWPQAQVAIQYLNETPAVIRVREALRAASGKPVLDCTVSSVVGAHCGPGVIGLVISTD